MVLRTSLAILILLSVVRRAGEAAPPFEWWITHSLDKVRPSDPAPERIQRRAQIYAARNEFEPFQIVLRTNEAGIDGLDVEISEFRNVTGASIQKSFTTVYFQKLLNLPKPSSIEGSAGLWPDPLIPRIDRYEYEQRNAFPFALRPRLNQAIWIEVFVPPSAVPGIYEAEARITKEGMALLAVPVRLTVWAFTLPETSSLRSSFGLNGTRILKQHMGHYTSDTELYNLTRVYSVAALQHRLSTHGGSAVPPKFRSVDQKIEIDWTAYDSEVGPLIEGTAIPDGEPLHGARATSVDLRTPGDFANDGERQQYWTAWVEHFATKNWDSELLFLYLWDEPPATDYPKVVNRGRAAHRANPGIRNLVTVPFHEQLKGIADIWVPLVNCLENKPNSETYCDHVPPLGVYTREARDRKRLWFYQSCASHGCSIVGGAYFVGWPQYMIDATGPANRVMQWVAWRYRVEGELYFNMVEAFGTGKDPWKTVFLFGGNGDGTLFYPGTPDVIGGRTHIPIESIRLKLIREGMEDYEYLALLSKFRGRAVADRYAARIVTKPYRWQSQAEAFMAVRREIGEVLDRLASARAAGRPSDE